MTAIFENILLKSRFLLSLGMLVSLQGCPRGSQEPVDCFVDYTACVEPSRTNGSSSALISSTSTASLRSALSSSSTECDVTMSLKTGDVMPIPGCNFSPMLFVKNESVTIDSFTQPQNAPTWSLVTDSTLGSLNNLVINANGTDPGTYTTQIHSKLGTNILRQNLRPDWDYNLTVVVLPSTPPPPAPATLTVSALPDLVGTGGSTTLGAAVTGGTGPFIYDWRGYRDDGVPGGALTMSSCSVATPQVTLLQPDWDFLFFVTVLDVGAGNCIEIRPGDTAPSGAFIWSSHCGNPAPPQQYYCTTPNQATVMNGSVRAHESDGPVASFMVAPDTIHANVDAVFFDASSSTNVALPVSWVIEYAGNIYPATPEDFMLPFGSWHTVYTVDTNTLQMTAPTTVFSLPGAYRALLMVIDDNFNSHTATQYFTVLP